MTVEQKRRIFVWKPNHEKLLLREVLTEEPYKHKIGTKEKGAVWTKIANNLIATGMKVSQRSVRETFDKMVEDFKKREQQEQRASGVEVEYDEIHQAMTDIMARIADFEGMRDEENKKQQREKATAEEMRRRATEKLSETKKRHKAQDQDSDEEANYISPKRKRSLNIADILKDSVEVKRKQQQEQADIKRREMEIRAAELDQQQQFYAGCLQQQQAFTWP